MIVASASPAGLEQNARRFEFAADVTGFAEDVPASVRTHCHPVWKVVLCPTGEVCLRDVHSRTSRGVGVVVPPGLPHRVATTAAYRALFIDPWRVGVATASSWSLGDAELAELSWRPRIHNLIALLGDPPRLDPRVAVTLDRLAEVSSLSSLSAQVGISPSRLRTLVGRSVGLPLARLRQWARLRRAIETAATGCLATAAAVAGFSDQAHLTRTAGAMLGRTPGSMYRSN